VSAGDFSGMIGHLTANSGDLDGIMDWVVLSEAQR
jgi:hypothetical protein